MSGPLDTFPMRLKIPVFLFITLLFPVVLYLLFRVPVWRAGQSDLELQVAQHLTLQIERELAKLEAEQQQKIIQIASVLAQKITAEQSSNYELGVWLKQQKMPLEVRLVDALGKPLSAWPPSLGPRLECDFEAPLKASGFTHCKNDDQRILQLLWPLDANSNNWLQVTLDYFAFMSRWPTALQGPLQNLNADAGLPIFSNSSRPHPDSITAEVSIGSAAEPLGKLRISIPKPHYWQQMPISEWLPALLLLGFALLLWWWLMQRLLLPIRRLALLLHAEDQAPLGDEAPQRYGQLGLDAVLEKIEDLHKSSSPDPVTGLHSRLILEDRLQQAIHEGRRSGRVYALMMLKIKNFTALGSRHGEYMADSIMNLVVNRVRETLRENDSATRVDRDCFGLLLVGSNYSGLEPLALGLLRELSLPAHLQGQVIELECVMGISVYPDHGESPAALIEHAEQALRQAEILQPPVQIYQADTGSGLMGLSLVQALRQAIQNDDLVLEYQPVVDIERNETYYFEALMRWRQPDVHNLSVQQLIDLAEQHQMTPALSQWVMETVFRQIKAWNIPQLKVGINLSMIDMHDPKLPERIYTLAQNYQVPTSAVMIEITEGQIMQNQARVVEVLSQLVVLGFNASIDDFGTGQASMSYLKALPVGSLKIDKSFVLDMLEKHDDKVIVYATIRLAHALDVKVTAEGVESKAALYALKEMGCDYAQGYFFSKPMAPDEVPKWIQREAEKTP